MATSNESYTQSLLDWRQPAQKPFIAEQNGSTLQIPTRQNLLPDLIVNEYAMPPSKPSIETDPDGKTAHAPGAKLDKGKVDLLRGCIKYFPAALEAVAHVSELGARKYAWMGWRTVPDGVRRYGAALARHLVYDDFATDSGPGGLGDEVLHASQVAWNALARLELILEEKRKRDEAKDISN